MRIVVNHLTRMRGGYICVAGLNPETFEHVRPVLTDGALPFDLLARYGGPFDMASVVDLRKSRPAPQKPHVEDHVIVPSRLRSQEVVSPREFWELLNRASKPRLRDIFGSDLRRMGRSSCGTDLGKGEVSLGCFHPVHKPRLRYLAEGSGGKPRIRIDVRDDDFEAILGVTDLRLYQDDHMTPDRAMVEKTAQRMQTAESVILGVGLTRAFVSSGEYLDQPIHWLQVNNIHLEADPTWQLG